MDANTAIIGAGPIGIEIAANFKRLGLSYLHFDSGQVGQTIHNWPAETPFFSSPERVAIAGIPVQTVHQNMLTGEEYLAYLRAVVEYYDLDIMTYRRVTGIAKIPGGFEIRSDFRGTASLHRVENIVLAHGNMHAHRLPGVPGEEGEHVDLHYRNVHRYFRKDLLIVGGRNSAVEAAIRCWRAGARVTLMHRGASLDKNRLNSRYHLEISILIDKGKIAFLPSSRLKEIRTDEVSFLRDGAPATIKTDFVMLCLGFAKDTSMFEQLGIELDADGSPDYSEETMETSAPGAYLAGTAAGGARDSYGIFVGTSHIHVERIVRSLAKADALVGDGGGRHYPFSKKDIEPTEGKA